MNAALGYALLRDRRVSLRPKVVALGVGLAAVGLIELLQLPFESVLALLLPAVGAAAEAVDDDDERPGAGQSGFDDLRDLLWIHVRSCH